MHYYFNFVANVESEGCFTCQFHTCIHTHTHTCLHTCMHSCCHCWIRMVLYLSVPHTHAHLHAFLLPLLNQNGIVPVSSTHTCTPACNLVAIVESEEYFTSQFHTCTHTHAYTHTHTHTEHTHTMHTEQVCRISHMEESWNSHAKCVLL